MGLDAGFAIERAGTPPPAAISKEDVTRFSTLEDCVAQHAVIDPLVGDAVDSLATTRSFATPAASSRRSR